ncbi:pentapeptide repeat-containing protein [Streptomyces sp. SID8358]|uniref:pentapeptide repeat-containing protein n=1 Tax=Streptomyces sp. SID8358 TaxID=2690342 RepID=UPI000DACED2E|nr:pentapeptide repeat-containing protein [Streptomyces sp. SID8358]MYU36466.1 pentapeptide repeat-containing protein [Streptomyces sp. SID8358]
MTSVSPARPLTPPQWQYCGHGAATATEPVGCRGIHVNGHTACLAHLPEADRTAYLATLSPGADIDHRGTSFTPDLLSQLLTALTDPNTGRLHAGAARFGEATFSGDAPFNRAFFSGDAGFDGATFLGVARFVGATFARVAAFRGAAFTDVARFSESTFSGESRFEKATFVGAARFGQVTFFGAARFSGAIFSSGAGFREASFSGQARFGGAKFSKTAQFSRAIFSREARFGAATFSGEAQFSRTTFSEEARFGAATFSREAQFSRTTFSGETRFGRATFFRDADFSEAALEGDADFGGATFKGLVGLDGTTFSSDAKFSEARFEMTPNLGPLACGRRVLLDGAVFQQPVTVEIAARQVSCARTRWTSTATLNLRYAELDLQDAVFEYPVMVAARSGQFLRSGSSIPLSEAKLSGEKSGVHLASVGGVDAAHLALHDIDLKKCRFAGAVHLDQMKVDGWCSFAATPTGWSRRFPWRWSRRNTLAEEHHWRVRTARRSGPVTALGWTPPPQGSPELKPAAVAALYRQLRKSLEDGKNEPDAADFYYGECEMRRHDSTRPFGERVVLTVYWALSGYGLRAMRALVWLVVAVAATITVMMLWGLPANEPKPQTTGQQVKAGQNLRLITDTPDPRNPTGPLSERVTTKRFEKSVRVVINSVIFRSSGQDLTTAGTYTEMTSRLVEPLLLGLAVLAVRSRVKR